ncbi:uncharacterized protein LOC133636347 isoform X2 [Entelurus aequoreus]|uniref:uncharacterized protein LOC133636347 isoform X2 n=1 Tax=Entelurus aequoreus TaxID=161455 RepID=UPI002B1E4E28|nr:uncharacterized protein LOC133636347 isoform X2 [Entelurus aequoreus]
MLMEQRLNVTVEEIFGVLERTIAEYEEELSRTKEENKGLEELLDAVFKPQLTSSRCQRGVMKRSGTPVWDRRSYRPPPTLKRSSFMMKMKLSPYSFITVKVRRTEGRSL